MTKTIPITKARYKLKDLCKEFAREKEPEAVTVTRRGEPILAVIPWDLYETLIETLEILSDKDLMEGLKKSIRSFGIINEITSNGANLCRSYNGERGCKQP